MKHNKTENLMQSLSKTNDIQSYVNENKESFINITIADALNKYAKEKGLSKPNVIKRSEINDIYGYQIFAGTRKPSRDILLCLCFGLTLNVEETQSLLKASGLAPLYPKIKRDSIILYGIHNNSSVCEVNEQLYSFEEPTL
ncbi:MAG: XRE family transcriptional regulator [Oscillospiraceae bacterium]|nr:XRE family transcriptional regulator [Oscillospiraceae bacterium]